MFYKLASGGVRSAASCLVVETRANATTAAPGRFESWRALEAWGWGNSAEECFDSRSEWAAQEAFSSTLVNVLDIVTSSSVRRWLLSCPTLAPVDSCEHGAISNSMS